MHKDFTGDVTIGSRALKHKNILTDSTDMGTLFFANAHAYMYVAACWVCALPRRGGFPSRGSETPDLKQQFTPITHNQQMVFAGFIRMAVGLSNLSLAIAISSLPPRGLHSTLGSVGLLPPHIDPTDASLRYVNQLGRNHGGKGITMLFKVPLAELAPHTRWGSLGYTH